MKRLNRILVIDDDVLYRQVLQLLLEEMNKKILLASSGVEGVEIAITEGPDLILCDYRLGDMQGNEVIQQLNANPATRDIPVVFMTGNLAAIAESGTSADYHLAKPFQVGELIELIEQIEAPSTSSEASGF